MADVNPPSSPLSEPPEDLPELSPTRQGEVTPDLVAKITPHEASYNTPSEVEFGDDNEGAPPKKRRTASTNTAPSNDKLYPPGLRRLTRFGKNTYGINTGPLADDADWDALTIPAIREQLKMRNVNHLGVKAAILDRIKNWKQHVGKEDQEHMNLTYQPAFDYNPDETGVASARGRGNKWKSGTTPGVSYPGPSMVLPYQHRLTCT